MAERVAVLGGGVAGLTAAHELAERGFEVAVYEARDRLGGKARSLPVPGSGSDGRRDLPAEHGFRFFPGFYRHVPDTMRRIGVEDHLVGADRILLAQGDGRNELLTAAHLPESLEDFAVLAQFLLEAATGLGVPPQDTAWFLDRLLTLLTSCDERRLGQWELQSWWRYVDADRRSLAFRKLLAEGLTRTLVAARAREMSARTGGTILLQLVFDLTRAGGRADRVLDGPTSDVWIDPWEAHLRGLGVEFHREARVEGIQLAGGRVASVTVGGQPISADRYVAAVPVEVMRLLAGPELRAAEPRLKRLDKLVTRWMNGVMFYLDEDVPLVRGHAIYIDSEWALTSISQRQFWRGFDFGQTGDGRAEGILSVDVSDWSTPSRRLGKTAMSCTREEVLEEVWAQLRDHVKELDKDNVLRAFLDPAIEFPNPTQAANLEPLLVNTTGSWADRPDAVTRIPNLFLASDYVRTHTDLATMEGANEAARRAVNGILEASGSSAPRCELWPLREPALFAPAKALDKLRWKLFKRPPKSPLRVTADGRVEATGPVAAGLLRLGPLVRRLRG
jgi:uncharacterized protein with NAD-binding domain and iron-sulfur cluster